MKGKARPRIEAPLHFSRLAKQIGLSSAPQAVHDPLQDGGVKLLGQPDCNLLLSPPVTPPEHTMPRVGVMVHSSARRMSSVLLNWISLGLLYVSEFKLVGSKR